MDKTLETKFFDAYRWGGVVNRCIDWIRREYSLPAVCPVDFKGSDKQGNAKEGCIEFADKPKLQRWHDAEAKAIVEAASAFDAPTFEGWQALFDEIESNLNECKTGTQKDRYLYSLLQPFAAGGYSTVFCPVEEIRQLQGLAKPIEGIADYKKDLKLWESLLGVDDRANEQINACRRFIAKEQKQIDWVNYVNTQFLYIVGAVKINDRAIKQGTVERCLSALVTYASTFVNRLDALLLAYGIDLLRLQRESGFYLKRGRGDITDVADYVGSVELAQRYIDALPKRQAKEPQQGIYLPVELQKYSEQVITPKATVCFAVAISKGFIERTETGYKRGKSCSTVALLAYFLQCVYKDAKGNGIMPNAALCKLFGETYLKQAANKIADSKTGKPRGGQIVDDILTDANKELRQQAN